MRATHQGIIRSGAESAPAEQDVQSQRRKTLGAAVVDGKQRDRAYFVKIYAFTEWVKQGV